MERFIELDKNKLNGMSIFKIQYGEIYSIARKKCMGIT